MLIGNPDSICKSLQKEQNSRITFSYNGEVYPAQDKALELVPFFRLHNSRYAVYFRQASEEQFKAIQEEMATAERKATELANQTIDLIFPGEQQPESDHGIQYEQAETGTDKAKVAEVPEETAIDIYRVGQQSSSRVIARILK